MEFVTGVLFALSFYMLGFSAELIVAILFMSLLVIITVSDIAYMLIPDKVLLPFAVVLFGVRLFIPLEPWWDSLLGAASGLRGPVSHRGRVERWHGWWGYQIVFRYRACAWYGEYAC